MSRDCRQKTKHACVSAAGGEIYTGIADGGFIRVRCVVVSFTRRFIARTRIVAHQPAPGDMEESGLSTAEEGESCHEAVHVRVSEPGTVL